MKVLCSLALMLIDHTSFYHELDPGDKISRDRESALELTAAQHLATSLATKLLGLNNDTPRCQLCWALKERITEGGWSCMGSVTEVPSLSLPADFVGLRPAKFPNFQ